MSSDQKIAANRANAQSSTGPQTAEGKAASSQNARKHGLSGRHLFVPEDRRQEFDEMYLVNLRELQPIGEIQATLFEQLVHSAWNLNLARELHTAALSQVDHKAIASAMRYMAQFERSYAKALKMLKDEQTDFALRAIPQNEPIVAIPAACRIEKISQHVTRLAKDPAVRHTILTAIAQVFTAEPDPEQNDAKPQEPALDKAA